MQNIEPKRYLMTAFLLALANCVFAQSIALSPATISPSVFSITATTAGANPSNPLTNYTSQSVKYTWPFLGNNLFGYIYVSSSSIPSGLSMTVQAGGSSGFWGANGTSSGEITVSSSSQMLISGIWSANNISRPLTQNIKISDFSQLHPGTYVVTVNYSLQ
ncbi:MAG: hypothetical protein Q8914_01920 [Bacteroidota bacterium]|nr:hypothetical protein [Bacteroidota bacterium]